MCIRYGLLNLKLQPKRPALGFASQPYWQHQHNNTKIVAAAKLDERPSGSKERQYAKDHHPQVLFWQLSPILFRETTGSISLLIVLFHVQNESSNVRWNQKRPIRHEFMGKIPDNVMIALAHWLLRLITNEITDPVQEYSLPILHIKIPTRMYIYFSHFISSSFVSSTYVKSNRICCYGLGPNVVTDARPKQADSSV